MLELIFLRFVCPCLQVVVYHPMEWKFGHLQWEVSESVGCKLALPINGEDQMTRIYCAVLDIFWNICATLKTARF